MNKENRILNYLSKMNELNRGWTKEETQIYQQMNNEELKEINTSLNPPAGNKTGKIGIFLFGQVGDLATATGVLKYMDTIFPNKEIIWFCNLPNADILRYSPVSEVRPWLWAGNGLPAGCPDYYPMLCDSNNRLNKKLAANFPDTADLEDGYFPAPHMVSDEKRHSINYPNVSKKIFGIDMEKEWHPLLSFSDKEVEMIEEFIIKIPPGKIIIFETYCGSMQSKLDNDMVIKSMKLCQNIWGNCNFIFVSHKYLNGHDNFPNNFFNNRIYSAAHFTPRQCALLANHCDLFISVSSGISVVSSCWSNKPFPMLQYCGSAVCGTKELANGEIIQVFSDNRPIIDSQNEFYDKLKFLLKQ